MDYDKFCKLKNEQTIPYLVQFSREEVIRYHDAIVATNSNHVDRENEEYHSPEPIEMIAFGSCGFKFMLAISVPNFLAQRPSSFLGDFR